MKSALRVMLAPFVLTLLVGGALIALAFTLPGLPLASGGGSGPAGSVESAAVTSSRSTDTPSPISAAPPQPTATLSSTPPVGDLTLVCEANARRFRLAHPGGVPVVTVSRLLAPPGDEYAYVIADGRLARVPLAALDSQTDPLVMLQTEPLDRLASGFPLQELTDLTYDASGRALLLLDKSGRVFRYAPGGQWSLVHRPELAPDNQVDPSYLTISAAGGRVHLLDADLNQVWRLPVGQAQAGQPEPVFPGTRADGAWGGPGLLDAVDVLVDDREGLLALYVGGELRRFDEGDRRPVSEKEVRARLPLGLAEQEEQVYVVDGLGRAVLPVSAGEGTPATGYRIAFPGLGLLRDAAFDEGGRLLAVAGDSLIVYDPDATSGPCPTLPDSPPLLYYGVDLSEALAGFRYPIDGAYLPSAPRSYPGARRLYRAGVHRGLDIHPWDAPRGIDIGEPVRAMQDGIVTRADLAYTPVSKAEFAFLTEHALALGVSLPGTLDRIGGRQVFIEHEGGVSTRYLHLDSVANGVTPGAEVKRGQIIGAVGVSGTAHEGDEDYYVAPHAHVEIWVNGYYLGQGLSLRETMWLWQQVFPGVEPAPLIGQ